jgi:hypothetical protein
MNEREQLAFQIIEIDEQLARFGQERDSVDVRLKFAMSLTEIERAELQRKLLQTREAIDVLRGLRESLVSYGGAAAAPVQQLSGFALEEFEAAPAFDEISENGRWIALPRATTQYDTRSLADWVLRPSRDKVYSDLFLSSQPNLTLHPDVWRLVFADRSPETRTLIVGSESAHVYTTGNNGVDMVMHRVGFRSPVSGDVVFRRPIVTIEQGRAVVRQNDNNLCSMHALNNVAGAFVMTPPLLYQSIYDTAGALYFSGHVNTGGEEGEVAVAALRRGIILGRVVISNLYDVEALRSGTDQFPRFKFIEILAARNGGVILLQPNGGHYVPLLATANGQSWTIYTTLAADVVETIVAPTFGQVLRDYYLRRRGLSVSATTEEIDARERATANDATGELHMLVPLHHVPTLDAHSSQLDVAAHYWARYIINNTQLFAGSVQFPVDSVLALNYAFDKMAQAQLLCGPELSRNPLTAYVARIGIERSLNVLADRLAAMLLEPELDRYRLGRAMTERERIDKLGANQSQLLSLIRGQLREPAALGLLLGDPLCSPLTNREWLRLAALHIVSSSDLLAEAPWQLLFLFTNCLFTDHRIYGDATRRYPSLNALWTWVRTRVANKPAGTTIEVLPKPTGTLDFEQYLDRQFFLLPFETERDLNGLQYRLQSDVSFDCTLWLLSAFNRYVAMEHPFQATPPLSNGVLALFQPMRRNAPPAQDNLNDDQPNLFAFRRRTMQIPEFPLRSVRTTLLKRELFQRLADNIFKNSGLGSSEIEFANVLLISEKYTQRLFNGFTVDQREDAESGGQPWLFERIYSGDAGDGFTQLRGTLYDRVNDKVDVSNNSAEFRAQLTTRYKDGMLASSTQPDISLEAAFVALLQ